VTHNPANPTVELETVVIADEGVKRSSCMVLALHRAGR
jgi:hypothetical protein